MCYRRIEVGNNPNRQDQFQIFGRPVVFGCRLRIGDKRADGLITADLHLPGAEICGNSGEDCCGGVTMHQQRLQGIADARSLRLGVDDNFAGHGAVGTGIDKDVTDSLVVLDDRDARILHHEADQALASPGDDEIDQLVLLQHCQHPFTFGERDERERCRRDAGAVHL